MRLSANLIVNYANTNQFGYANQWIIRAGDPNTLYFQVVDLDQNINNTNGSNGQNSNGPTSSLRYMVGCGAGDTPYSIQVKFCSIDDSKTLVVQAAQADDCDSSVWSVSLSGTQIVAAGNIYIAVTEGNSTRTFKLMNALAVEYNSTCGSC
jgi:hypothetical protein